MLRVPFFINRVGGIREQRTFRTNERKNNHEARETNRKFVAAIREQRTFKNQDKEKRKELFNA